jgi:hypothetical protein
MDSQDTEIMEPPVRLPDPSRPLCLDDRLLNRMVAAVEKVRDRLIRSTRALEAAGVPYAVVGGNAVAAWVSEVDESAARNTQDVDILLRREDLERATEALSAAGFIRKIGAGITMFLDGPDAKARDAVHVVFANEKVRPDYEFPAPDVEGAVLKAGRFRVVPLQDLVRMKLTSNRDKDRTHIRDFIFVGLVDAQWPDSMPAGLADRLRRILDNPEG